MLVTRFSMDVLTSLTVNGTDGNTYYKATADADFGMKSAIQYGISQLECHGDSANKPDLSFCQLHLDDFSSR